jgi:predicted ferric reductase
LDESKQKILFVSKPSWQDSLWWGICLIALYLLLATAPVIFSIIDTPVSDEPLLVEIAFAAAMLSFSLICLQVLLAGRFKTMDRSFGLDILMRFHKSMGVLALVLVLSHPVLLALGHQSWKLFTFDTSWQVYSGKAALLLLILGVLFAFTFVKLGIDYNIWRFTHKIMILVIMLGFAHAIFIGPDIQNGLTRIYWLSLFAVVSLVFTYRNVFVPLWGRHRFIVSDVKQETHDTYTLTFEPRDGKPICRNPGQFMFLKLLRPGRLSELHPFTISASPLKTDILQATIKQSGNFTNTIDQTKTGDIGKIEAPFGRFSYVYDNPAKILFIAGGVGITPIMSMIRCLRETDDNRPVILLYGNKTEKDILFRQELAELPNNFKSVHILSHPSDNWQGEQGYITNEIIDKYAGDVVSEAHVYLCGPPVMMDKVIKSLHSLNVSDKRIHYERFTI